MSQALVHLVIDRASLFTDHRISGRPIRAKYKHFKTIWEHTFDISHTDFNSSSCRDGRQCKKLILYRVVESFCSPTHNIVPHISWHDPPCHRTRKKYADFLSMVIFQLLLQKFWIQTWFCNCQQSLLISHCL